ncbi:MAG: hypothetical protein ACM3XM_03290 [Mycobacterium leprae]
MTVTDAEKLSINELLRLESMELLKLKSMMPMMADEGLHGLTENCLQTAKAHCRALVDFCEAHQLG